MLDCFVYKRPAFSAITETKSGHPSRSETKGLNSTRREVRSSYLVNAIGQVKLPVTSACSCKQPAVQITAQVNQTSAGLEGLVELTTCRKGSELKTKPRNKTTAERG